MRHKTKRTLVHKVRQLIGSAKTSYLELGELLCEFHGCEEWWSTTSFRTSVEAEFGIGYRKAAALMAIAVRVRELGLDREIVVATGWTKMAMINPKLNASQAKWWLSFAHDNTAATLVKALQGEVSKGDDSRHGRVFMLSEADNASLLDELMHHGMRKQGRGHLNKEAALMSLVAQARSNRRAKSTKAA